MADPIYNFTAALDGLIDDLLAKKVHPVALSMPEELRIGFEEAIIERDKSLPDGRYRGLQIRSAFPNQKTVAVIDDQNEAHCIQGEF